MSLEKKINQLNKKSELIKKQENRLIQEVRGIENFKKITGELYDLLEKHNIDNSPVFLEDLFDYVIKVIH